MRADQDAVIDLMRENARLRARVAALEENAGLLRNAVEGIGIGGTLMTPREATIRAQCRMLVRAFDEYEATPPAPDGNADE